MTEKGDAQFYLLGPLPDQACELCVSRIGGRYILEDGSGRLLFEHRNLDLVALHARAAVPSTSWLDGPGDHAVVCDSERHSRKARADDRGERRAAGAARAAACGVRLIASFQLIINAKSESVHDREICDVPRRQDVPQSRNQQGNCRSKATAAKSKAGKLPEWNLADLYSGIDAPEVARDLERMDAECVAFETDYKGKLAENVAKDDGGEWLAAAVKRYEAIDDLDGPARLLCRPDPRRRQRRSRDLEILRRRVGAADGRIRAFAVLRARTQPAGRQP